MKYELKYIYLFFKVFLIVFFFVIVPIFNLVLEDCRLFWLTEGLLSTTRCASKLSNGII